MQSKTLAIAVALIVVVAGIGAAVLYFAPDDWGGGEGKDKITVTDDRARNVDVYVPVERVVIPSYDTLNPFVGVVGENFSDYIVGGLAGFDADIAFRDIYYEKYPELKDVKGVGDIMSGGLNVAEIIGMEPDVVFLPSWGLDFGFVDNNMLSQLERAKIPAVFVDFYSDPFKSGSYERNVGIIGKVMGKEDRADSIIEFFQNEVAKVYDILPDPETKTTVYVEMMQGPNSASRMTSKVGTPEIEYTNGWNIANDLLPGSAMQGEANPEAVLAAKPDVICFAASTYYGDEGGRLFGYGKTTSQAKLQEMAEEYMSRPGWKSEIPAVADGKVFFTYAGFRSNLECFATLQYMATWLYPEIYGDLDPEANAKAFYNEFMPFELSGIWAYQYQVS